MNACKKKNRMRPFSAEDKKQKPQTTNEPDETEKICQSLNKLKHNL